MYASKQVNPAKWPNGNMGALLYIMQTIDSE